MSNFLQQQYGLVLGAAVSTVELQSEYLRKRTWTQDAIRRGDAPRSMRNELFAMGRLQMGGTFTHAINYELVKSRPRSFVEVQAAASTTGTQTLTVLASNHNIINGRSIVPNGFIVTYPGGVQGRITGVTYTPGANTFTVVPHSGLALPAVAYGQSLFFSPPTQTEFGSPPPPIYITDDLFAIKYDYQPVSLQTSISSFKVRFEQDGPMNVKAPMMMGSLSMNGQMVNVWHAEELATTVDMWDAWEDNMLMHQTADGTGTPVTLADGGYVTGIMTSLFAGGMQLTIGGTGLSLNDLQAWGSAFNATGQMSKVHDINGGRDLIAKFDFLLNGLQQQDDRQGVGNDFYTTQYRGIKHGGHTFNYAAIDSFDDVQNGYQAMGYSNIGVIFSKDPTTTISGRTLPNLEVQTEAKREGIGQGAYPGGMHAWYFKSAPGFSPQGPVTSFVENLEICRSTTIKIIHREPWRDAVIM